MTYFKPLGHWLEICDSVGNKFTGSTRSLRMYMAVSCVDITRGNTKVIRRVGMVLSTLDIH